MQCPTEPIIESIIQLTQNSKIIPECIPYGPAGSLRSRSARMLQAIVLRLTQFWPGTSVNIYV